MLGHQQGVRSFRCPRLKVGRGSSSRLSASCAFCLHCRFALLLLADDFARQPTRLEFRTASQAASSHEFRTRGQRRGGLEKEDGRRESGGVGGLRSSRGKSFATPGQLKEQACRPPPVAVTPRGSVLGATKFMPGCPPRGSATQRRLSHEGLGR